MNPDSTATTAASSNAAAASLGSPTAPPPPSQQGLVTVLNANDVLLGRGAPVIDNEGNLRFRQIVHTRRSEYLASTRRQEKDWIARQVMVAITNRGGRFLRKIDMSLAESQQLNLPEGAAAWTVVDEDAVLLKVKQAMRDRSLEDEDPRPRRRRRVRSNNVVLDEDLALEGGKRAARRPRTDEPLPPSHQNHPSAAGTAAAALSQGLQAQQQQQPLQNEQSGMVDFFFQQQQQQQQQQHHQHHHGHPNPQQQAMMLAELQRQQHERHMAQLIEEHRIRNSLGLQSPPNGNFGGGMTSLRDLPASLGAGFVGGISGGLPDIATLARLQHSVHGQSGNLAMQNTHLATTATAPGMFGSGRVMADSRHAQATDMMSTALPSAGQSGSRGEPQFAMTGAATARRPSSQASTAAGQVARLPPRAGAAGTMLDEASQQPDDDMGMKESSGELAIEKSFDRMNKNPGGSTLHGGQYLKISLIEGCLLFAICFYGIPQWSSAADDMADDSMFTPSPADSQGKGSFTWADLSALVKENVGKLKSSDQSSEEEEQSALTIAASSNPALASSAAILAQAFVTDPKEFARRTIMLLEKLRIHSRIEQTQNNVPLSFSNGSHLSSSGLQTNDSRDLADNSGASGESASDMKNVGSRQVPSSDQEYFFWLHLSADLGKWATTLDVANEGTSRPIAHSLCDITPKNLAEEEVVTPVAALDMSSSRKILDQAACLSRLRSIFHKQSIQDITEAVSQTSAKPHMIWASRPTWWPQHDIESITRDVWLLENLVSHGLASILDVPISSKLFPVGCLRDAGVTKAGVQDRAVQLTVAIHEQLQSKKRVQVEQERASKLSAMMVKLSEKDPSEE